MVLPNFKVNPRWFGHPDEPPDTIRQLMKRHPITHRRK